MGVITQQEYEEKKRDVSPTVAKIVPTEQEAHHDIKETVEYFLLHPEVEIDAPKSFEYEVDIDKEKYLIKCENNIVRTKDKILSDFLIGKEYILMRTKEI